MSLPLHCVAILLGLLLCMDCATVSVDSRAISPDIGEAELVNAKELLRREVPDEAKPPVADEKESSTRLPLEAPAALLQNRNRGQGGPGTQNPALEARQFADWAAWNERETGSAPAPPGVYENEKDPWLPLPPKIHHVPFESKPSGYWKFESDHGKKYAANHWHPFEPKEGPPHYGVAGHWDFPQPQHHHHHHHGGGGIGGGIDGASESDYMPLRERMKLKNAARRNPSVPHFKQTWPPSGDEGYNYHGHWTWHENNDHKHPDWERPEEIMSKGNAALGPGRWAWNWQHQNEIWKPMPREEYLKWKEHIQRISPDHSIYETSNDPICASCAGGCALPGKCEFQASDGWSLEQWCVMEEGRICSESYPGVKPPEKKFKPPPVPGPGPSEAVLGAGYWNDMDWVSGKPGGVYSH